MKTRPSPALSLSSPGLNHNFSTALGVVSLGWNENGLTYFHLGAVGAEPSADDVPPPAIAEIVQRAQDHFAGQAQDFSDVTLDWTQVTPFQKRVYLATQSVTSGQTTTYGALARELGQGAGGARAVGAALGANPWLLIVPCHRVVAADGQLTGFSAPGGVRTKARLLALEGAELLVG